MPKTVLVIDDEPNYREMIRFVLSDYGYAVLTAAGGEAAIEVIKNKQVDLIITDMKMPKMDGLDTVMGIKELWPSMPIILMTGFAKEDRIQRVIDLKVVNCLIKPFLIDKLLEAVNSALQSD